MDARQQEKAYSMIVSMTPAKLSESVARLVMGWEMREREWFDAGQCVAGVWWTDVPLAGAWRPTEESLQTFAVMSAMRDRKHLHMTCGPAASGPGWIAHVSNGFGFARQLGAETGGLAVCRLAVLCCTPDA